MKKTNYIPYVPALEVASATLQEMGKFYYQRLDKLKADCQYYLSYGRRNSKHLEGHSVDAHIENMWDEWRKCRVEPDFLTAKDIELFRMAMASETNGITFITQDIKGDIWDWVTNEEIIGKDDETDINKYLSQCWFVEKIVPTNDTDAYYILWIGGKLADTFSCTFIDELLEKQQKIINYITK